MTPDQVSLVQQSFRAILPIREQAAALFYQRLFQLDPALRPLFAHVSLHSQGAKLMAALGFVVGSLNEPGPMLAAIRALAVRHVGYGVRDAAPYASVGRALISTLEAGLGDAWTPQLRDAWSEAYALLSGAMIQAAQDAASEEQRPAA